MVKPVLTFLVRPTSASRRGETSFGKRGIVFTAASGTSNISRNPWTARKLYGCFVSLKPYNHEPNSF